MTPPFPKIVAIALLRFGVDLLLHPFSLLQAMLLYYYVLGVAYHGVNSFIPTLLGEAWQRLAASLPFIHIHT